MKKLFITLLLFLCGYVFIGCGEKDYSLEINVVEKVFVGDTSNYEVVLLPDNTKLTDYNYSSSNNDVLTVNKGTIIGVSAGEATIKIVATVNDKEVKGEALVTVNEKEASKDYKLAIEKIEYMEIGDTVSLNVKESTTDVVLTNYQLFSTKEDVIKIEDNKLVALKCGTATINVSCVYDGVTLTGSIDVMVLEQIQKYNVTFKGFDGVVLEIVTVEDGSDALAPNAPEVEGYVFVGWDKEFTNVNCDLEVNAIYEKVEPEVKKFKVTFKDNEGNTISEVEVEEGKAATAPSAPELEGYNFIGWDVDFSNVTSDLVVTAKYEVNTSKIKTNIGNKVYVNQLIEVEVYDMNDNQITDYELIVGNEDVVYYEDGLLEPFDIGTSLITIKANIDGVVEEYSFTLEVLEGFTLSVEVKQSLTEGETVEFKTFVNPGNIEITNATATTNNKKILSIVNNQVTALLKGTAILSVDALYEGVSLKTNVTINVKKLINTSLDVNVKDYIFVNESKKLEAIIKPYETKLENFEVSIADEYKNIISYTDGNIKALALGKAKINVKATFEEKDYEKTFDIVVYEINGIKLEIKDKLSLNEVCEYKVLALPNNVEITDYVSASDNDNILLNQKTIFANKEGTAKLTVKYNYNGTEYSDSSDLLIEEKEIFVERLYVSGSNGALEGSELELSISTYPKVENFELEYSSSDETIAKVDANGLITTLKEGKVTIKVSLKGNSDVYSLHNVTVLAKKETSVVAGSIDGAEYQGRYYEESVKHYYELMNGITETSYVAYTSTKTAGIDVDGYTGITGTIEVDKYYPQNVHVFEVPSSKNTKIVPWANLKNDKWTLTSVKGLINDYEEQNPGSKVICAINGDFFDINANGNLPYQTTGENVSDGEFYKTSNGHGVGVGGTLGFTNDGSNVSLISGSHAERTSTMILAIYDESGNIVKELNVETLNALPQDGQSSVFFGVYNSDKEYVPVTFTANENTFIIESAEKALPNNANDFYGLGTISKVATNGEEVTLEKGSFAIVSNNEEVKSALKSGLRIRIQYEFTGKFASVESATGYNRVIYEDVNQLPPYIADRAPRTCVGMRADGTLVMMVIDGRQGGDDMYGADGTELAAIMNAYGCINAYNLDGGGSSTIVVRDESGLVVLNTPSDGRERNDGNCILIVTEDPNYKAEEVEITSNSAKLNVYTNTESYKGYTPCLKIDGVIYECVNGEVTINNLVHNTTYNYKVMYKADGEYYETLTTGSFTTCKTGFKFLGITLKETDTAFIYTVYAEDLDKASNVFDMEVDVDGQVTFFKDGTITLKKSIFGDYLNNITFKYWYEENNQKIEVVLEKYNCYIVD